MSRTIIFNPTQHAHLIPQLVQLHITCITTPTYTIATFLPPLNPATMLTWWQARAQEVGPGSRAIVLELAGAAEEAQSAAAGAEVVVGVVMLAMSGTETVPLRAWVEKLLVLPEWRGKGVGKALMGRLEAVAVEEGKLILILDTEKGSQAEFVYPKLGYQRVGEIPAFLISPLDRLPRDAVLFCKDLR